MIKDRNIANDAGIQLHKILGATMGGLIPTGEIFWCGDNGDAAFNSMRSRVRADRLYTDLDACVGACTANRGDIIVCMEGFSQSVIAAGGLDLDVAGITIVFLGTGTSQANITFSTAVTADMDVDAADITLIRPKFVAGIDSLEGPIDVNSTDFTIIDGEYHDATDIETTDCIVATSGATRLKIDGWKYISVTETGDQKQSNIQLNGCDDIVLKNIDIRGNFFVGCIENVTDEVLNARFENFYLENLNATPKPALFLDANSTGSCKNVKLKIYSGSTYVSNVGKMSWDNRCEGFMGDGVAGDPIGTALASGIEGKIDIIDGFHDVPTADTSDNAQMRDVVGNKTDAAAAGAVSATESLMAYVKQIVGAAIIIDAFHDVPTADTSDNAQMRDVVGNKTDAAAAGAVSTTESLMAYVKQLVGEVLIAVADTSDNLTISNVVGNKTDAAASGAVSATESLMAYMKQAIEASDSMTKDNARYLAVVADQTSATWNSSAAGGHEIATVTGLVRVRIIPEITSNIGSGGAAVISLGTETTKNAFIAATTATGLDANELWWSSTDADNVKFIDPTTIPDFIVNGDDIGYLIATTSTTAGSITFHIWWEPLESGASVVAGAGGTL